ncbi:hypothetical protein GGF32_006113, partial [Allomyces javanicus]
MFRDRYFRRESTALDRSSRLSARIHHVFEDVLTAGAVSPARLDANDANFAGLSLRDVIENLDLEPTAVADLRRSVLLDFIEEAADAEGELLRFDVIQMHVNALELLREVILAFCKKLLLQFRGEFYDLYSVDVSYVA